jgi:hypothetical protein
MRRPRTTIAILVAVLVVTAEIRCSGENAMKSDQPIYFLQLRISHCAYDVRVNDCPVTRNLKGLPVTATYPLNLWLVRGENELTIELLPLKGQRIVDTSATFQAFLELGDKQKPDSEPPVVGEFVAKEAKGSATSLPENSNNSASRVYAQYLARETRSDGRVTYSFKFNAAVPTERWVWSNGKVMFATESVKSELLGVLSSAWQLLDKKNIDALADWFAVRNRELAAAKYKSYDEERRATIDRYRDYLNDTSLRLDPLWTKDLTVSVFGHGKLARLDDKYGESPLYFANKDYSVLANVVIIFYRDSTGKLIPIR